MHVSVVMMASMSVSKGLPLWQLAGVAGVERSEIRGWTCFFSAVGVMVSEAKVSCDGFWMRRVVVVSTVRPTFSEVLLWKLEVIVGRDVQVADGGNYMVDKVPGSVGLELGASRVSCVKTRLYRGAGRELERVSRWNEVLLGKTREQGKRVEIGKVADPPGCASARRCARRGWQGTD